MTFSITHETTLFPHLLLNMFPRNGIDAALFLFLHQTYFVERKEMPSLPQHLIPLNHQQTVFRRAGALWQPHLLHLKFQVLFSSGLEGLSVCLIWCGASATPPLVDCSSPAIIADDIGIRLFWTLENAL